MSTGIDMRIEGVDQSGRSVCALATELRDVRARWDRAAESDESACGMDATRSAFVAMRDAWFADRIQHHRPLRFCDSLPEDLDALRFQPLQV